MPKKLYFKKIKMPRNDFKFRDLDFLRDPGIETLSTMPHILRTIVYRRCPIYKLSKDMQLAVPLQGHFRAAQKIYFSNCLEFSDSEKYKKD